MPRPCQVISKTTLSRSEVTRGNDRRPRVKEEDERFDEIRDELSARVRQAVTILSWRFNRVSAQVYYPKILTCTGRSRGGEEVSRVKIITTDL